MTNKISQQFYEVFIIKKLFYNEVHIIKQSSLRLLLICEFDTVVKIELELSPR